MKRLARSLTAALLATALVAVGLAAPLQVAACLCGEASEYTPDVRFEGRVISTPDNGPFDGAPGVYRFEILESLTGDPGDGRVYDDGIGSSCGSYFELGAVYLVHAERIEPDIGWDNKPAPGVPLVTGMCRGNEFLAAASPAPSPNWAVTIALVALMTTAGGLGIVAGRDRRAVR